MFYASLLLACLLIIPLIEASALPQQTPFANSTATASSGTAAITGCQISCKRKDVEISSLHWRALSVTATITAETVILVVNGRTNVTSTTTITNAEVDLKTYTPATDLNSAGTRTTAVVVTNDNSITTHIVAYPTTYYQDYPSSYTICGTLPTTVSGVAACIEHSCVVTQEAGGVSQTVFDGAPSFKFPSHPLIAWPSQTTGQTGGNLELDPKGLTYEPVWDFRGDWVEQVQPLFPDLAAWNCRIDPLQRPDSIKAIALYLTATSTATESGDVPSDLPIYTGTRLPINENGASQAPTMVSGPLASKPEQAATKLPETSPGNAPESPSTTRATKQVPSNQPVDAVAVSSGLAKGDANALSVEAKSPTKTSSPEKVASPPLTTTRLPAITTAESPEQAATTASVGITISSTDEQGHVTSSVAQLPAPMLPSTNQHGFSIVATSPGIPGNEAASIIFNSHTISGDANTQYLVSGQPLIPGSPVTLGSGAGATPVVIHTSSSQTFLVVGSSTSTLAGIPTSAPIQAVSIGTQVLAANSESLYVVGTQTLAPGVPITLGSGDAATPVEMHTSSSHTILVFGSRTQTLFPGPTPLVPPAPAALTIASQIVGVNSEGGYIIGSQTLVPGSPITLGSGSAATPALLQTTSKNTVLIIGSSTSTLIAAATTAPQPLIIGSQVVSTNSQNQYIIGSQTLTPGSPITLGSGAAGTPVLLQTSGSQTILVAGSITSTLAGAAPTPPPFTIGSQVVTANAQDQYVVGSQTLTPGAAITVAGTPVSLAPSGTQVVVGTSTAGLGNYIMSGLGTGPSASASGALPFTGAAGRSFRTMRMSAIWGSAMAVLMAWL